MRVMTDRSGATEGVEVDDDLIFEFSRGLGGFEDEHVYALIVDDDSPVDWLQSVKSTHVGFPLLEPFLFYPEYGFELPDSDASILGLKGPEDALVRCVLTLRENAEETTANLLAPIILNRRTRQGRQVVLQGTNLSLRYPVFTALREPADA